MSKIAHPHLSKLEHEHAALDKGVRAEEMRPLPDAAAIQEMKKRKLRLKEDIVAFRAQLSADVHPA